MVSEETTLRIEDLVSGYGDAIILKGVTFNLNRGEIACIIGANGAGKSTLLKTIFGILKPHQGSIIFEGYDISSSNPINILKRGISYVMQGRSNFPLMTVQENLEMGGYIRQDNSVKDDMDYILNRFPLLREKLNVPAGNLSGGQQQILEMAMALMLHPKLIMLDEPTLGLAPQICDNVFEAIKAVNADGTTVILVEQNAKRALSVSDRGLVLELGRVKQEGPGLELLNDASLRRQYLGG